MLLLQSHDRFDDIAMFEPSTGGFVRYSKAQMPHLASQLVRGHFARLDGRLVILYRDAGLLHLRIDDADFQLTEDVQVDLAHTSGGTRVLTITQGGASLFQSTYTAPVVDPPLHMDPTFVAAEDFDFGLFVYNVMRNPGRRDRIYEKRSREQDRFDQTS